ncbi:hypothetical protein ABBQ38_011172 [Trebouxia sp. C0009 RCD-2024]
MAGDSFLDVEICSRQLSDPEGFLFAKYVGAALVMMVARTCWLGRIVLFDIDRIGWRHQLIGLMAINHEDRLAYLCFSVISLTVAAPLLLEILSTGQHLDPDPLF